MRFGKFIDISANLVDISANLKEAKEKMNKQL